MSTTSVTFDVFVAMEYKLLLSLRILLASADWKDSCTSALAIRVFAVT